MDVNKKVLISVKTVQYVNGQSPEELELITQGDYYKDGDDYYAEYDESEISGMNGTKTTLKIGLNCLSIIRRGTTNSDLMFKQGQKHISLYSTPYGTLEVMVNPEKVDVNIDDNGGNVDLRYKMEASGTEAVDNELKLNIRELNNMHVAAEGQK